MCLLLYAMGQKEILIRMHSRLLCLVLVCGFYLIKFIYPSTCYLPLPLLRGTPLASEGSESHWSASHQILYATRCSGSFHLHHYPILSVFHLLSLLIRINMTANIEPLQRKTSTLLEWGWCPVGLSSSRFIISSSGTGTGN